MCLHSFCQFSTKLTFYAYRKLLELPRRRESPTPEPHWSEMAAKYLEHRARLSLLEGAAPGDADGDGSNEELEDGGNVDDSPADRIHKHKANVQLFMDQVLLSPRTPLIR